MKNTEEYIIITEHKTLHDYKSPGRRRQVDCRVRDVFIRPRGGSRELVIEVNYCLRGRGEPMRVPGYCMVLLTREESYLRAELGWSCRAR